MSDQFQQQPVDERGTSFTSSYVRSVDSKGRFNLPFRFRKGSGDESYVAARGTNGTLCLMTSLEWSRAYARIRARGLDEKAKELLRKMSRHSHTTQPDSQGRIQIPPKYLAEFGINEKVEVIGMGHFMELWPPAELDSREETSPDMEEDFLGDFYR